VEANVNHDLIFSWRYKKLKEKSVFIQISPQHFVVFFSILLLQVFNNILALMLQHCGSFDVKKYREKYQFHFLTPKIFCFVKNIFVLIPI
jgi:hypothetical protein